MDTTHKIKAAAATLTVGFLLAIALAGPVQAGNGKTQGWTAQQLQALQARSEAWNRFYGLGAFSSSAASARQAEDRRAQAIDDFYGLGTTNKSAPAGRVAEERRAEAMNRYYRLGRYTVVGVSSGFAWTDAGIGAGAMLGAIVVGLGLAIAARRRASAKPSFWTTT